MYTINNQTVIQQLLAKLGKNNIIVGKDAFRDKEGNLKDETSVIRLLENILEENGLK